jgi:hypothetical protein
MPATQKRDSAYLKKRLSKEAPKIYGDLLSGKYPSVRAAALAAGIIKGTSRLTRLKNDYSKASPAERQQFRSWLISVISSKRPSTPAIKIHPLVGTDGRLSKSVCWDIQDIMNEHRLKPADVCEEIGLSRLNPTWLGAYKRHHPPKQAVLDKLAIWLAKHGKL